MNGEALEMMTIEEVARSLRILVSTIYRLAQQWRFSRTVLERWIETDSQDSLSAKNEFVKQMGE